MEEEDGEKELTDLQREIEHQLEKDGNKRRKVAAVIGTSTAVLGIGKIGFLILCSLLLNSFLTTTKQITCYQNN